MVYFTRLLLILDLLILPASGVLAFFWAPFSRQQILGDDCGRGVHPTLRYAVIAIAPEAAGFLSSTGIHDDVGLQPHPVTMLEEGLPLS